MVHLRLLFTQPRLEGIAGTNHPNPLAGVIERPAVLGRSFVNGSARIQKHPLDDRVYHDEMLGVNCFAMSIGRQGSGTLAHTLGEFEPYGRIYFHPRSVLCAFARAQVLGEKLPSPQLVK